MEESNGDVSVLAVVDPWDSRTDRQRSTRIPLQHGCFETRWLLPLSIGSGTAGIIRTSPPRSSSWWWLRFESSEKHRKRSNRFDSIEAIVSDSPSLRREEWRHPSTMPIFHLHYRWKSFSISLSGITVQQHFRNQLHAFRFDQWTPSNPRSNWICTTPLSCLLFVDHINFRLGNKLHRFQWSENAQSNSFEVRSFNPVQHGTHLSTLLDRIDDINFLCFRTKMKWIRTIPINRILVWFI